MITHIEDIAHRALMKLGFNDASIHRISDPGSSTSRVFLYSIGTNQLVAVKILSEHSAARVTLSSELENRSKLSSYIEEKIAEVYWYGKIDGYEVIVYEAVGSNSLHGEVLWGTLSQHEITTIWEEFLHTMTTMWLASARKPAESSPRPYENRMHRIESGVKDYVTRNYSLEAMHAPMVINGNKRESIFELVNNLRKEPRLLKSVTCHGDPQPSNIIINRSRRAWKLIDWEWSGEGHDWRMMAAHMYGWWFTRTVRFERQPMMTYDGEQLNINYSVVDDSMNNKMLSMTLDHMKEYMHANRDDLEALKQYLALLLLGEVRFAHIWGREAYIPYLIGMAYELLLSDELVTKPTNMQPREVAA